MIPAAALFWCARHVAVKHPVAEVVATPRSRGQEPIGHGQMYRHEALLSWSRWMEKRSLESPDFKADTINVRLQL